MGFLGEYSAKIDVKGRFLLPVDIKKQIEEVEQSKFILNRGFEKCLILYTQKHWQPLYQRFQGLNDFKPQEREFKRFFMSGARHIDLDSVGRMLVPKHLITYAQLKKEIILVGSVEKIELWDKGLYESLFENYTAEKYSEIAQKVMGNRNEHE